jgi:hypothetical protein
MTDLLIAILLSGLAVYRAAKMIATEEGPFSLFLKLRNRFLGDSWIDRGLHCPLCVGFWLALIPSIILAWVLGLWLWVVGFWFAIAGVQAALQGREKV